MPGLQTKSVYCHKINNLSAVFILGLFLLPVLLNAQEATDTAEADTGKALPVSSAVWRSVVLPGWGQIYQERLAQGAVFSFGTLGFYFNALNYLNQYNKYGRPEDKSKFRAYVSLGILFHIGNIIDAADAGLRLKPKGWQGELLGDKPLKSPWGAVLRSAIIPGWGQVYTENYVKATAYFAVNAFMVYRIHTANVNYWKTKEIKYKEDRTRFAWYFGVAYLITLADAYASAYLYKFDEALEMALTPVLTPEQIAVTLYVRF